MKKFFVAGLFALLILYSEISTATVACSSVSAGGQSVPYNGQTTDILLPGASSVEVSASCSSDAGEVTYSWSLGTTPLGNLQSVTVDLPYPGSWNVDVRANDSNSFKFVNVSFETFPAPTTNVRAVTTAPGCEVGNSRTSFDPL